MKLAFNTWVYSSFPVWVPAYTLEEERREAIEQYKQVIDLCADLGGNTVLYIAGWQIYGTSRVQAWNWSAEALKEVALTARDRGVVLAIEPTPTDSNLIESCDHAIELMEQVAAPNVKLMFDTQHAYYRNEVPTDYVYKMGKNLHHVHLSEFGRLAPGQGTGDFVGLVAALREVGYDGYLAMEIGFNRRNVEPDLIARQAYEYLKPLVTAK